MQLIWTFDLQVMFGKGSIYSGPNKRKSPKKVPYEAVLKDINIWAVLVAGKESNSLLSNVVFIAFGNFMGTQLSLQFMPTYINKVSFKVDFSIQKRILGSVLAYWTNRNG